MAKFPQNKIWKQNNLSDLFGDIWSSWNLDLTSSPGKLKTTRTLNVVSQSGSNPTDCGIAVAFRYYDSQHFALTGNDGGTGIIFASGTERTSFSQSSVSGDPTTVSSRYSDMEIFNDILYVSVVGTDLYKNNAGTWTDTAAITGVVSGVPHLLCVYTDRLYITADYAKITSINTSDTSAGTIGSASYTLDLGNPQVNTITFMRATSEGIWIGTLNRLGGKANIHLWNGVKNSVLNTYRLESSGAMAAVVKDDVIYVMENDGRLVYFNGAAFVELDRLPLKQGEYLKNALLNYNTRWIHPNGMSVQDNRILMLIDGRYRSGNLTAEENIGSGVWEWSKETGLYHKYSLSYMLNSSGTLRDYGQNRLSSVGAIYSFKSFSTSASDNGSILVGAQLFTDGTNTRNYILIDDLNGDTAQKYGYFVTPKIFTQNLTEIWNRLVIRFKKFLDSGDTLTVKYRTEDAEPTEITITTWSASNKVRTSTSISSYSAGDEIEFLQGEGAGKCFHIESTSDLGGGITEITLDGSFVNMTGDDGKARLQKWKKFGSFSATTADFKEFPLLSAKNSPWVQLKICLQNTGDSYIYDAFLITKEAQAVK